MSPGSTAHAPSLGPQTQVDGTFKRSNVERYNVVILGQVDGTCDLHPASYGGRATYLRPSA